MTGKIKANEYPLSKIFSQDFEYHIPPYQRPYVWTTDESGKLIEDLQTAFEHNKTENYFMGSLVLIKKENETKADVVDGQQRLTTLTILIAAIVKCLQTEESKQAFSLHLKQPRNVALKLDGHSRLSVRPKDKEVFEKYILNYDFERLASFEVDYKKESHKNIKKNAILLYEKLQKYFPTEDRLLEFGQFLVGNCYLVVVSAEDQESASRIFSVLNSRGLDLLPTDILKAEIIDKLVENVQNTYTEKWEALEEMLSREGFMELFSYIRMIYVKSKADKSLLEEFRKNVIPKKRALELIDDDIFSYAKILDKITNNCFTYGDKNVTDEINFSCSWLNRIAVSDWKPVALAFCKKEENNAIYINWFLKKLERLAAVLFITGASEQTRINRFADVLTEIERNEDTLQNPLQTIELTNDEKTAAMSVISSDIYTELTWLRCKYIVLRTDSFVSDTPANYDLKILSIEHVLPQTMNADWKNQWSENDHRKWLNKIANLVLLSRRKNSQAKNFNFNKKKEKYFSINGTTSFALTTQVLAEQQWNVETVEKRQQNILAVIKNKWSL